MALPQKSQKRMREETGREPPFLFHALCKVPAGSTVLVLHRWVGREGSSDVVDDTACIPQERSRAVMVVRNCRPNSSSEVRGVETGHS